MNNPRRIQNMLKRRQEMLAQTRIQLNREYPEIEEKVDHLIASVDFRILYPDFYRNSDN